MRFAFRFPPPTKLRSFSLPRLRPLFAALLLGAAPSLPPFSAQAAQYVGSVQLLLSVDQTTAYANGQTVTLGAAPRNVGGRVMLPLRETAAVLEQPLTVVGTQLQLGRLLVAPQSGQAWLAGAAQEAGSVTTIGGVVYVSARLLADGLGANFSADGAGRQLTITALRSGGNPLAPQARFSTDKTVYAPGERVVYTEYSFDPDGANITSRRWSGNQDAFFKPGVYTVSLQVTNARGVQSAPFSRTIRVEGAAIDTPLGYALKYADLGDAFPDPGVLNYPSVYAQPVQRESFPLLFSDSPEAPRQSGVLYQDTVAGRSRLLAYHLNALGRPARLYIMARNLEARPVEVRSERLGETAPTRVEGQLGQVTLLEYFASNATHSLTLAPGELAAAYASPTLSPGSGVNVLQDLTTTGRVELTFMMLEEGLPPTLQVIQQLPYLPLDGRHQRGTFDGAVRSLRVNLTRLPARLVIGDGLTDPAVTGVDRLTGQPMRLLGNYGVLYDLEVNGTADTAVALSPRGGLYRGAMNIQDGPINQTIKLPRTGNALQPEQPVLLWRPDSNRLNIDFVPSSGSNLPISLVFYPVRSPEGNAGLFKTYQP
ncbi:MAG: stalk domain-containing protein [Deinococcus sp.]|uniref:stalk domain-containing protein n=1 Tax=Deinococcus sp. TaxID=47478 RepID=UPI0026DB0D34|nr:stalk domain-containing protein [Deinococcus sp.]MDO4245375.1 stalk domain-containing protein [Deinococcus sp.]